ncbi:unnamed protein product [Rotaria sp. Silwood1]|nr:unnamed protein product [Rotaria sp. Silwood1]
MNQTPIDSRNDIITTEHQQKHIAVQKEKYIKKRLILFLHAYKCQRHEIAYPNTCTVPYCSTMKDLLQHMIKCDKYRSCTFTHCFISRQIILHWRQSITAIKSITDVEVMCDTSINNLDDYIRRIEDEAFKIANNEDEYFRKLAEIIYKIQKQLDDRQEKIHLQENIR